LVPSAELATGGDAEDQGAEAAVPEPTYVSSLGFRVSSFRDGVLVDSPDDCPNVSDEMKLVVRRFTDIIRSHPELPVYDQHKHSGTQKTGQAHIRGMGIMWCGLM
jgi:hypothetical protein